MDSRVGTAVTGADAKEERTADFFVAKDGLHFAGTHLLLELWDGEHFDDLNPYSPDETPIWRHI